MKSNKETFTMTDKPKKKRISTLAKLYTVPNEVFIQVLKDADIQVESAATMIDSDTFAKIKPALLKQVEKLKRLSKQNTPDNPLKKVVLKITVLKETDLKEAVLPLSFTEKLSFHIDPGKSSIEDIQNFLEALANLHRVCGGFGITINNGDKEVLITPPHVSTSDAPESADEDEEIIVYASAVPSPVPVEVAEQQRQGTSCWHLRLLHWLRSYAADDISRIKEAGIDIKAAEAQLKVSKAVKNFAKEEFINQKAKLKKAAKAKTLAKAGKISAKAAQIREQNENTAVYRVSIATSKIRHNGGKIFLNKKEIEQHLLTALKTNPQNPKLLEAKKEIEEN
jgi:hypothetical protein